MTAVKVPARVLIRDVLASKDEARLQAVMVALAMTVREWEKVETAVAAEMDAQPDDVQDYWLNLSGT